VHEFDNVVIADSSVFPTASGYGPTLTLVALAARAAHHLADTKPRPPAEAGQAREAGKAGEAAPAP
jgi:choline dehydrogenase-like flavoprotein